MIELILGWGGAGFLLGAYGLLSTGKLKSSTITYQLMNVIGSICLLITAYSAQAWPFVTLNIIWAIVGLATVVKLHYAKKQSE